MAASRASALVLLLLPSLASANEGLYASPSSAVTSHTSIDAVPKGTAPDQPFMLVEFYSAWCGHCQHFAPVYESIALKAKAEIPRLHVAAVNCVDHEDICTAHSVSSYPTIILFPGEVLFKRSMDARTVIEFVREHASAEQLSAAPPSPAAASALAHAAVAAHTRSILTDANATALQKVGAAFAMGMQHDAALHNAAAAALGGGGAKGGGGEGGGAGGGAAFSAAAASARQRWPGIQEAGNELAAAVKAFGIPDVGESEGRAGPHLLRPRPMPRPVPSSDVLAAARYSLHHDIASSLSSAPTQAYARKRLGALRAWLHTLHRSLPHDMDGGAMVAGTGELLSSLHGHTDAPHQEQWTGMLAHAGIAETG